MVSERIAAIREKLNRREKKIRANRRAKSRRIEREEPQGASEKATVKVRKAKRETNQSAEEARELAADAKTLIATELGVSPSEAESVIKKGSSLFEDFDGKIGSLDGDGDGDTDLLGALDQPLDGGGQQSGGRSTNGGSSGGGALASDPIFDPFAESDGVGDTVFDPFEDGPQ